MMREKFNCQNFGFYPWSKTNSSYNFKSHHFFYKETIFAEAESEAGWVVDVEASSNRPQYMWEDGFDIALWKKHLTNTGTHKEMQICLFRHFSMAT